MKFQVGDRVMWHEAIADGAQAVFVGRVAFVLGDNLYDVACEDGDYDSVVIEEAFLTKRDEEFVT